MNTKPSILVERVQANGFIVEKFTHTDITQAVLNVYDPLLSSLYS